MDLSTPPPAIPDGASIMQQFQLFAANLRLYEALGYHVEREEELNGGVAVHMSKACANR